MKKKKFLFCFINFSDLDQLDTSPYIYTLVNLSKKFGKISLVNIENLTFSKKNSNNYPFVRYKNYFNLIDPKSLKDLGNFIKNKEAIVLNSIQRAFKNLPLLIYLNINKVKLLEVSNLGNLQIGTEYFLQKKNFGSLNQTLIKNIIKKIFNILSIIRIISKIDCKFTSNKKIYLNFINKNFFQKFFTYYKDVKLVKSNIYEIKKKESVIEKYIVLLDVCPLYEQFTSYQKVNNDDIKKHYKYLGELLNCLSKIFKKKVVVCTHPKYPLKFYKNYLPKKKVVKYKTKEFIMKSFVVLTYNSSAIVNAIKYDKKIISVQSFLFKGAKYSSSIYQERLGNEKITLKGEYTFNKKELLKRLQKNIKKYKKFKKLYFGIQSKNFSSQDISNYIINN